MSNILPNDLIRKLGANPFFDQEAFIAAHESGEKLISIRLNPQKSVKLSYPLDNPVPWCDQGYYLSERPVLTLDPLFHAGCYYVQEASSMFVAHILKHLDLQQRAIRALDLCAAPGGKSTLINSYLNPNSLLVSNEIIKSRSIILQENMMRWGNANVVVSNNDSSAFRRLPGFFDLILVDAPCSGSGMFRKDENSVDEWSEATVKLCKERQQRILADVIGALSTNGYLLYSTCSYSVEENEEILDWLVNEYDLESVHISFNKEWGIEVSESSQHKVEGYRFYPHKTKGEGFFIAVLKTKSIVSSFSMRKMKFEKSPIPKDALKGWIKDHDDYSTLLHNDSIHIYLKEQQSSIKAVQQVLYLKNAGTLVGKWLGKEIVPAHDLAMSIQQSSEIPGVELGLEDSIKFLRKEPLEPTLLDGLEKGWCLIKYNGVSLGWVKVLGNRVNNYYPKDIRIANL